MNNMTNMRDRMREGLEKRKQHRLLEADLEEYGIYHQMNSSQLARKQCVSTYKRVLVDFFANNTKGLLITRVKNLQDKRKGSVRKALIRHQ